MRLLFVSFILLTLACHPSTDSTQESSRFAPYDQAFARYIHPDESWIPRAGIDALSLMKTKRRSFAGTGQWITEGPSNIGARINTVAMHPQQADHILVGFSSGGAYLTEDGGTTWEPVFDDNEFLAIGDIVFSPHDPNVVMMSTGDPNISGFPFLGNGVFRSSDGGRTWRNTGLKEAGIISKVAFHPSNPQIVLASSMGLPYQRDERRGLYRSSDGGQTWIQILQLGEETGVIDFLIHPQRPDELYAAGWDRIRTYDESKISGEGAQIHRSLDGGTSWTPLSTGLPSGNMGRIGLAMAPSNPDRIYALYVNPSSQLGSIHTSNSQGQDWDEIPTDQDSDLSASALGGFGWYFGKLRVDPQNESIIYVLGVDLWKFNPDLQTWSRAIQSGGVHADKHDLIFRGPDTLLLATDGGLYQSLDGGSDWQDIESIPTTQFYRVDYNPHLPELTWGGAQDNGISRGNASGIDAWIKIAGADGFRTLFHPEDPEVFYVESQRGGFLVTSDGGQSFQSARSGIDPNDRRNWDLPIIMSRHDPDVLYYGTTKVYRSTAGVAVTFAAISEELTDPVVTFASTSNITALAESPITPAVVTAGTGDGNLWITEDNGQRWEKRDDGLPDRWYTSLHFGEDEVYLYATQTGYKAGVFLPYVHRSTDRGRSWESISGNLPNISINDIFELPNNGNQVLFVATDGGAYFTEDAGSNWVRLGQNMPIIPIYELTYNPERNLLLAGTFGKSIMSFSLDQIGLSGNVSVSVRSKDLQVRVFPNPAQDHVWIESEHQEQIISYTAIDDMGQTHALQIDDGRLMVRQLPPGVYTLVAQGVHLRSVTRFVKI